MNRPQDLHAVKYGDSVQNTAKRAHTDPDTSLNKQKFIGMIHFAKYYFMCVCMCVCIFLTYSLFSKGICQVLQLRLFKARIYSIVSQKVH